MGNKLLLADDSITIQKVVGIIFANEDYELTIVDNGTAALEKAKQSVPDIMLVDAVMPGMTGYEVCEQVRRTPGLQHVPLLLMTGAFEAFDEDKAKKSGADEFISKPFESQALVEKVRNLIEMGKSRGAAAPQPSVATPPPPQPPPVQPQQVQPPPVQPPPVQPPPVAESAADSWADLSDEIMSGTATQLVPPPKPPVPPTPPTPPKEVTPAVEVVESGGDDDLWGSFELEEVSAGEVAGFNEVAELDTVGAADEIVVEDAFSFQEETPGAAIEEIGETSQWGPVGEEAFDFGEETVVLAEEKSATPPPPPVKEEPKEDISDFFALAEEPPVKEEPVVAAKTVEAPLKKEPLPPPIMPEPEPTVVAATTATVAATVTPAVVPPVTSAQTELSEEQLTALVARISRDILEKIAWEVVPDLAESIIKEEIRKIKEGA
jgi:CheY-like chemotaxis protein